MASLDSGKLIKHALNQTRLMFESDSEVSTIDLNLLENLNTNQSLNYIKLEQELSALETNAGLFSQAARDLRDILSALDAVDLLVVKLGHITNELHGWTKDLAKRA